VSAAMIALRHNEAARDRPDAAFDKAGVMIKNEAVDADLAQ